MREIKFRAWDKNKKKMVLDPTIYGGVTMCEWDMVKLNEGLQDPDFMFMQYTGLKDKNDKEIYEGDVIKYRFRTKDSNEEFISEVFWDEYMWITNEHSLNRVNDEEIIGNIYENPEFLNLLQRKGN